MGFLEILIVSYWVELKAFSLYVDDYTAFFQQLVEGWDQANWMWTILPRCGLSLDRAKFIPPSLLGGKVQGLGMNLKAQLIFVPDMKAEKLVMMASTMWVPGPIWKNIHI